jgi:TonB family protein
LLRLVISPTGKVIDCQIAISSKFADLDAAACFGTRRARFSPGRDKNGNASYALFENWVTWSVNGDASKHPDTVDVELVVDHLPHGSSVRPASKLVLVVSKAGIIESCSIVESSGNKLLDEVACRNGVQSARIFPLTDENGNSVESVQPLNVAFSVEAANSK